MHIEYREINGGHVTVTTIGEPRPAPTPEEIVEARDRLAHLEAEFYLCSLGDRPQSPGVDQLEEARKLREFLRTAGVR